MSALAEAVKDTAAAAATPGEAGAGTEAGSGAGAGGGAGEAGAAAVPSWRDALPETLRGHDDLARMGSVEDLAKGYVETRAWSKGRVALPKDGDAASFAEFAARVRPESPDAYTIEVPEGVDPQLAEAFRPLAHDLGLHPVQAQRLSAWWNDQQQAVLDGIERTGHDEIKAIDLQIGSAEFARSNTAIGNMLAAAGIELDDIAPALEKTVGAGKAWRALAHLARATGELEKVDGADVAMATGSMTPDQADAAAQRMISDPNLIAKLRDANSPERKRYDRLVATSVRSEGA